MKCVNCNGEGFVPDPVGDVDENGEQEKVMCLLCGGRGHMRPDVYSYGKRLEKLL